MRQFIIKLCIFWLLYLLSDSVYARQHEASHKTDVHLGPRPFYLAENMPDGELKQQLAQCQTGDISPHQFSIGHRGAPMQFPEHTKESYLAAVRMGAGIVECDVTFTKDKQLVCRHAQCDLHQTTDILLRPELASKCTEPFMPAKNGRRASAKCCASDITLNEFKSLCGKMDGVNPNARNVESYLKGTPNWRTELYNQCATLMTHQDAISLFSSLGIGMIPELKSPEVKMPFQGNYSQRDYALQLINEYRQANVPPTQVWLQSFNFNDIRLWQAIAPEFTQRVYLDDRIDSDSGFTPSLQDFQRIKRQGAYAVAPPLFALLKLDNGEIVASDYAKLAKQAGLVIYTWTLERSGSLENGGGWYYQTVKDSIHQDGDVYRVLDVLAKDVGVQGVFSDWPATTTYYAHCMDLN